MGPRRPGISLTLAGLALGLAMLFFLRWGGRLEPPALPAIAEESSDRLTALPAAVVHSAQGSYELVLVPGGAFTMGSPPAEHGRQATEDPAHPVAVSSFYLGRYPVTNADYGSYLEANPGAPPPAFWRDPYFNAPTQPVVGVSWHDARAYCAWAGLRLPTEAEWEYACRAGTTESRYGELEAIAWCRSPGVWARTPVGSRQPNRWGLHDMLGTVWEWCADSWHGDYRGAPGDGSAWRRTPTGNRVARGGGWSSWPEQCRAAARTDYPPSRRSLIVGFRGARALR